MDSILMNVKEIAEIVLKSIKWNTTSQDVEMK